MADWVSEVLSQPPRRRPGETGLLYRGLVAAVVTKMGVVATAVVAMPTVEVPGVTVPIAFVGLRGALEANKCQQAESCRARERE